MNVYGMAVDTILICYIVDYELFKHEGGAKSIPPSLKEFLSEYKWNQYIWTSKIKLLFKVKHIKLFYYWTNDHLKEIKENCWALSWGSRGVGWDCSVILCFPYSSAIRKLEVEH